MRTGIFFLVFKAPTDRNMLLDVDIFSRFGLNPVIDSRYATKIFAVGKSLIFYDNPPQLLWIS